MQVVLAYLVPLFAAFKGPIMGLLEKGIAGAVIWLFARGGLDPTAASGVAGEIYLLISGLITIITKTQTAKIADINGNLTNGVKVVAASANAPKVTAPIPG